MRNAIPHLTGSRFLPGSAAIAAATGFFLLLRPLLEKTHFALLYLAVVVLVAGVGGTRAGLLSAALSFLAWNFFFIPPYYTFEVSDPTDWLSLGVFLLVGLVMGLRTGQLRERESYALARERETALLYQTSSHLARQTALPAMAEALMNDLVEITSAPAASLLLPGSDARLELSFKSPGADEARLDEVRNTAQWAFDQARCLQLPAVCDLRPRPSENWPVALRNIEEAPESSPRDLYLPLQGAEHLEGILHLSARNDGAPYAPREEYLLMSIAHMAGAFLERDRLSAAAAQADAVREASRLKTTLVSSVSHELKTPLAAVTATITGLTESDLAWDPAGVRRELEAVSADLHRLNSSIVELLDLSRLEAGAWEPAQGLYDLGEILGTVLERIPEKRRDRIILQIPDSLPPINVDYTQWVRALQNPIENALAYSPTDEPVEIGACALDGAVEIWVEDRGPGLSEEDREHAFEKFYRGSAVCPASSGTGLGLTITAEIVNFHGGNARIENASPAGARCVITLPTSPPV